MAESLRRDKEHYLSNHHESTVTTSTQLCTQGLLTPTFCAVSFLNNSGLIMLLNYPYYKQVGTKSNITSKIEAAKSVAAELGVFRANNLVEAGFPRVYLKRLLDKGDIIQVGRGLYAASTFEGDHNQSLLQTSKRFPKGVICLMSALQFHEIGTQAPFEVWLAIPSEMKLPRTSERLSVRFCKFSESTHSYGVKKYKIPGGTIPVYSPAKTIADCFKYRNKYGLDVAVEALREGWREKKFTLKEMTEAAKICRVAKVIQPYLEMLA